MRDWLTDFIYNIYLAYTFIVPVKIKFSAMIANQKEDKTAYSDAPLITLNKIAIIAITNKIWINPDAWYPKKPTAQAIINMTAIKYNRFPMINCLLFFKNYVIGIVQKILPDLAKHILSLAGLMIIND